MALAKYGEWCNFQGWENSIEGTVETTLGDAADDYDVPAIALDWWRTINETLPDGVTMSGNEFFGPCDPADYTWDGAIEAVITELIKSFDVWTIAPRYELWTAEHVAEHLGYRGASAAGTARKAMSRWGVKSELRLHPESRRPQARYRSGEVQDAAKSRPGQGARTDRQ